MDKDRIKGAAKNIAGKAKTAVGKVTGDEKLKNEGRTDQVKGKVQNVVGGVKDSMREADEEITRETVAHATPAADGSLQGVAAVSHARRRAASVKASGSESG